MRWPGTLRMRLMSLLRRKRAIARLDEELSYHIDRATEENIAAGMARDEARRAAIRSFGNPALLRDATSATWSWPAVESLLRDLRYASRGLLRTPGFALIAVIVMGLGIGASVALFTVVRGVILRPLPFRNSDQLLMLYESKVNGGDAEKYNQVAGGIYSEWKKQNGTFASLAVVRDSRVGLSGSAGQLPEKLNSGEFSWDLLPTLGVQPAIGRNFTQDEDSPAADGKVLLSWQLWQRRFAGDPGIVNRTIYIDATPCVVIGVMPAWFDFPNPSVQLWQAVYHQREPRDMSSFSLHRLDVVGRLKPGVSQAQAIADLGVISRRIHDANLNDPFIFAGAEGRPLLEAIVGDVKRPLLILLAATALVLLIACLNVANLLVARAAARRKDQAIRTALGGGWQRLMRERLFESLLLSVVGGALGLAFAEAALQWLMHSRKDMNRVESIYFDAVVTAFIFGVVVLSAVISGLISTLSMRGAGILNALHESSRTHSEDRGKIRLRRILLSVEVSLTAVLLIGAGLLLKSYERLRSSDMGCLTRGVLTMHIGLPDARYPAGAARVNFFDTLLRRVRGLRGVTAAGFVDAVPGMGYWTDQSFRIVEHPAPAMGKGFAALVRTADPGYFEAIGIPFVRGRTFNPQRRLKDADEVVIDEAFAGMFFPGEQATGKHIQTKTKQYVIVGVVGSTRTEIGENPRPILYLPLDAGDLTVGTIVVRSGDGVGQFALPVQRIVSEMDSDLPVSDVLTMDQLLGKSTLNASFNTALLVAFASLSLLLAGAGLFGVVSYIAAQRTREVGIRMALGAQRGELVRLMLMDGVWPAMSGLGTGLVAALGTTRILRSMLYKTQPLDAAVYVAVAFTLLFVAVGACILPAWRASRLDPVQALRAE